MFEAPAGGRVHSLERAIALLEAVGHLSPEGESVAPLAVRRGTDAGGRPAAVLSVWASGDRLPPPRPAELGELTVRAVGRVAALVDLRAAVS